MPLAISAVCAQEGFIEIKRDEIVLDL